METFSISCTKNELQEKLKEIEELINKQDRRYQEIEPIKELYK